MTVGIGKGNRHIAVDDVLEIAAAENYELRALILGVATHPLFLQ